MKRVLGWFKFGLGLRVSLVICVGVVAVELLFRLGLYVSGGLIALLWGLLFIELYHYVARTGRDMERLLQAIAYDDFTVHLIPPYRERRFRLLYSALNAVMARFKAIRKEHEARKQFLHRLLDHVATAVIVYKPDGTVELMNPAARRLLQLNRLVKVQDLPDGCAALRVALLAPQLSRSGSLKIYEHCTLAVSFARSMIQEEPIIIAALQDIRPELEAQEWDAWQSLMKVLTHEIMNSLTPITSLAEYVQQNLEAGISTEEIADCRQALATIEKRSQGLLHFVQAYRSIIYLPQPDLKEFPVSELWHRLEIFLRQEPAGRGVFMSFDVRPPALLLKADAALVEQALINLALNAFYALQDTPQPILNCTARLSPENRVLLAIEDNGCGIPPDVREKIFIPFFSTRESGSGIGLSLCRQIMQLHQGSIRFETQPQRGTVFYLVF